MEHTHLVKGLDFALLQKVRSEIINREKVEETDVKEKEEEAEEDPKNKKDKKKKETPQQQPTTTTNNKKDDSKEAVKIDSDENKIVCKTVMAKNIVRNVFNVDATQKNELFHPGRMAYIVELEEDLTESSNATDVPTTIIRYDFTQKVTNNNFWSQAF